MQLLIQRIHANSSFHPRMGWLGADSMVQVRSLLKKQATLLLKKHNFDASPVITTSLLSHL